MLLITIILLELFLIIFKIYYLKLKKFCKVVQGLFYVLLAWRSHISLQYVAVAVSEVTSFTDSDSRDKVFPLHEKFSKTILRNNWIG